MIYGTAGQSFLSSRRNCFPSGQKIGWSIFFAKKGAAYHTKVNLFFPRGQIKAAINARRFSPFRCFAFFAALFRLFCAVFAFFMPYPFLPSIFAWLVLFPLFAPPFPRVRSPPAPLNFHAPLRFAFAALNPLCFSAPDFLSSRFLVFCPLFSSFFLSRSFSSISRALPSLHAALSRPHIIN